MKAKIRTSVGYSIVTFNKFRYTEDVNSICLEDRQITNKYYDIKLLKPECECTEIDDLLTKDFANFTNKDKYAEATTHQF